MSPRLPFRRLVTGPPPEPGRIFYTNLWFRDHNNPRYAELLPRLDRLDKYVLLLSDRKIVRGLEYRGVRAVRHLRDPVVFRAANRRYSRMFTADNEQLAHFVGASVSDVDDPRYSEREVALMNRPGLKCYVVTAERAARRFEQLGVDKPWEVIPQGVSLQSVSERLVAEVAARHRREGEVVVGYMAAWLLSAGDRGGDSPLYNVDHLLELWDRIHERAPAARLWLIGGASPRVEAAVQGRADIVIHGRLPRDEVLSYVANFDVALYPRTKDQGIQAAKVAEYMGLGVPTVSYDYLVTAVLRETGSGLLVETPEDFVDAVASLVADDSRRAGLAAAARTAGRELDWDVLAGRYRELLDRYLPRSGERIA